MLNLRLPPQRRSRSRFRFTAFLVLFFLTASNLLLARVFYLSPNGNDSNSGSLSSPWATFTKANDVLAAGDTLMVRGGVYYQYAPMNNNNGTATRPIVVMAYPGEKPILDGQNSRPSNTWQGLIDIYRRYRYVIGLEVRNSAGSGIRIAKTGGRVSKCVVHECHDSGILAGGDSSIVEDNLVYNVSMNNVNGQAYLAGGDWSPGITACRGGDEPEKDAITDYAIIRRNTCYNSWGEGISTFEARHTLMEDNVVYDAWSATFYISDAAYIVARRNLIYGTYAMPNRTAGLSRSVGLYIGNERYVIPSQNDTVYDNMVYSTARCLYIAHPVPGSVLANNTFLNSTYQANWRLSDPGSWKIVDNIVEQDDGLALISFGTTSGPTYSHNLWSTTPPSAASGPGDVVGDPKLAKSTGTGAGQLSNAYFALQSASPAIDAGINVGFPYNSSAPDMGAMESGLSAIVVSEPTSLPAPTQLSPTNGATGLSTTLTFSWTPVTGATSYRVQVSTASDFSTIPYNCGPLTTTSYTVSGMATGTRYYWRCRAGNSVATGVWSPTYSFTTTGTRSAQAKLGLSTQSLDFGETPVGEFRALPVSIINNGGDTLRVANIAIAHPSFTADVTSLVLGPGESFVDTIRAAAPLTPGSISEAAIISSNGLSGLDTIVLRINAVSGMTSVDKEQGTPGSYALLQNFPNPFNPTTTIAYNLPAVSRVTIEVYDILGARVRTLINDQEMSAGQHAVQWDGKNESAARVSTGTYIYRIRANGFTATKQMLLLN